MKKIILFTAVIVVGIALAGVYKFNFTNDDIHVVLPDGSSMRYDALQDVTLLTPNGGEVLKAGKPYTIQWGTKDIEKYPLVSISIRSAQDTEHDGQLFDPIVFVGLENDGAQEWVVKEGMYPAHGAYILSITAYESTPLVEGNHVSDESDAPFTIITSSEVLDGAIRSYEECAAAGFPIMESYPERCSDGVNTFTRVLPEGTVPKPPSVQVANPASVNCIELGGTLEIIRDADGEYGECTLPSGKVCEEWALFRGECK